jgi:hypothetical protein
MDFWMNLGDFNLVRCLENRNREGGDVNNMLLFNIIINQLDLEQIPLKGRHLHGATCSKILFWKSLIGFLHLHIGLVFSPTPWLLHLLNGGTPAYHPGFPLCIQFTISGDRREST